MWSDKSWTRVTTFLFSFLPLYESLQNGCPTSGEFELRIIYQNVSFKQQKNMRISFFKGKAEYLLVYTSLLCVHLIYKYAFSCNCTPCSSRHRSYVWYDQCLGCVHVHLLRTLCRSTFILNIKERNNAQPTIIFMPILLNGINISLFCSFIGTSDFKVQVFWSNGKTFYLLPTSWTSWMVWKLRIWPCHLVHEDLQLLLSDVSSKWQHFFQYVVNVSLTVYSDEFAYFSLSDFCSWYKRVKM
jgi:hypothetical protein